MKTKTVDLYHTRIKRTTTITAIRSDQYSPMTLIVDFLHSIPDNYYIREEEIIYAIYIDREFVKEFLEKSTKFQLQAFDVNHIVEVFAHPHGGFQFERSRLQPGNKLLMRFRAKDPSKRDVDLLYFYWDNATGTYLTKKMGQVNPSTLEISGRQIRSAEII